MLIEPIYYAVFYDLEKPRLIEFAMNKRIEARIYRNLTDDNGIKTVMLKDNEENIFHYKIKTVSTFSILNTIDNHFFVVCDCEKI